MLRERLVEKNVADVFDGDKKVAIARVIKGKGGYTVLVHTNKKMRFFAKIEGKDVRARVKDYLAKAPVF